jgi:hypothetical protein
VGLQVKRDGAAKVAGDITGTAANYLLTNIGGNLVYRSSELTGSGVNGTILGRSGTVHDDTDNLLVDGHTTPTAVAYLSANQSISNSTVTKVAFDTVEDQTNGEFDTSASSYTAEYPGRYQICGTARFVSPPDQTRCIGIIDVNGATVAEVGQRSSGGINQSVPVDTIVKLSAGDEVTFNVYQDSGGALDIQGKQKTTRLSITQVGGTDA